ncbi:hypothetical protein [Edwardsiella piscicida]|uniref:hypothetical protein n=1 Tax=Edwardsiella piscicida TaxID=1263550 RepID=UPI00370D4F41
MKRLWTKQEERQLEQWISEGRSVVEIAAMLGRTYASVSQKTYVLGLPRHGERLSQWDINMAHALRAAGLTQPTIARKLELKTRTVEYILYRKKPEANHAVV